MIETINNDNQPDLALLSLLAAREADREIAERSGNWSVIRNFGEQLRLVSGIGEDSQAAYLTSDPSVADVFLDAFVSASERHFSDINQLSCAIRDLVEPIMEEDARSGYVDLAQLKSFCLAFHKSMMAQQMAPMLEREGRRQDEIIASCQR